MRIEKRKLIWYKRLEILWWIILIAIAWFTTYVFLNLDKFVECVCPFGETGVIVPTPYTIHGKVIPKVRLP